MSDPTLDLARRALSLVCARLPHLSGLAQAVRLHADDRVQTAGVAASGRLVLNPNWFGGLTLSEAVFVLAHELLHLALRHHDREVPGADPRLTNHAEDAVINDMLAHALDMRVPRGGIQVYEARTRSVEAVLKDLLECDPGGQRLPRTAWGLVPLDGPPPREVSSAPEEGSLASALREAGLAEQEEDAGKGEAEAVEAPCGAIPHDLLDREDEERLFPGASADERELDRDRVGALADQALPQGALFEAIQRMERPARGTGIGGRHQLLQAVDVRYRPPWEQALQRWTEHVAPGRRSYDRPSRRGAGTGAGDAVRPGRRREGWTLNIVLDTSGSMTWAQTRILGVIGSYCRAAGVDAVRILQCDADVHVDENLDVGQLTSYRVAGYGGSDMSPAMERLADDPEVEAVIVITDGWIDFPEDPMPYAVLWATTEADFVPGYGLVVPMDLEAL